MKALVTGGCKGFGASFSKVLLELGYEVYAIYNTSEFAAREMEINNNHLKCIPCDITKEEKVAQLFKNIDGIDLLINNAGIANDKEYIEKSGEEFLEVLNTNVVGTFLMCKYAVSKMNRNSTIINISSNNALNNYNPLSMDYDASKAGVNILTKDFALELKDNNIKVVAICPGWIRTEAIENANPQYVQEEMKKVGQKELLDPLLLARKIISSVSTFQSGAIVEIKNL